jgi:hypothetical protein
VDKIQRKLQKKSFNIINDGSINLEEIGESVTHKWNKVRNPLIGFTTITVDPNNRRKKKSAWQTINKRL